MNDNAPDRRSGSGESRTQRALNVLMRGMLNSPLHRVVSGRVVVLTIIGRRTGRTYRIPVGYVEVDGDLLIGTAGTWRHNLRPDAPIDLLLRGERVRATAEVITDEDRCAPLYEHILKGNPVHGRYARVSLDEDGAVDRVELRAALERGIGVVRLTPVAAREPAELRP